VLTRQHYSRSPESIVVRLARNGDRQAFSELVSRRQAWVRNLMRRSCGDSVLADDLSQQVFLQAWKALPQLHEPGKFGPWLKRLAVNEWLQYARRNDPVRIADELRDEATASDDPARIAMDLDAALATLAHDARLCIVLAYHEGMTHDEIAQLTDIPAGTVKSHIRRGTVRLREQLAAYAGVAGGEQDS
jgi:RNA polymerase sigma-70 factor (ECF subfamily)